MRRLPAVLLIIIAVSGMAIVNCSNFALGQIKPSVPEFTLKYIDNSYDVPATYGIDPYTGKSVITQPAHHIENRTIVLTVTNQPFTSKNGSGHITSLYYNVRWKGHFSDQWFDTNSSFGGVVPYYEYGTPNPSLYNSPIKIITFSLEENSGLPSIQRVSDGGQIDFQIQALIGYTDTKVSVNPIYASYSQIFTGEASAWSETQTITLSESSASASPLPSTVPEFSAINIVALILATTAVAVAALRKKRVSFC